MPNELKSAYSIYSRKPEFHVFFAMYMKNSNLKRCRILFIINAELMECHSQKSVFHVLFNL